MAIFTDLDPQPNLSELGFNRGLVRPVSSDQEALNTTPELKHITLNGISPNSIMSGELPSIIFRGKLSFEDTAAGFIMGIDPSDGTYKWIIGDSTSSADWNVTTPNTFTILADNNISGWTPSQETWTYATASTFTISGDKTGKYTIGDKIRFIQGTAKYFYISGMSYSAPNTTITVPVNTDYTIANAAIVEPFFSKESTPLGFPGTFAWTPVFTGVSSQPTVTATYSQVGKMAFISCFTSAGGVSDNVAFYITNLPAIPGQNIRQNCSQQMNNSGLLSDPAQLDIVLASTTMQIYKDLAQAVWTNSGTKYVNFSTWYFL